MGAQLWLMRHGETEWSLSGAHTSRTDIPLTAMGCKRAEKLREFLAGTTFDKVLVSPMKRAQETCRIAGLGDQMVITDGLREWDYGESEGKTTKEMRAKYGPEWSVWTSELVGGEPLEHTGQRADGVIAEALEGVGEHGKVALFAHGHILRILAARWVGLPPIGGSHLGLGTGSASILGWERDTRVIQMWNREFEE